jgi:two-component system cell cycle sensor histidine kinase/response regulator CckA
MATSTFQVVDYSQPAPATQPATASRVYAAPVGLNLPDSGDKASTGPTAVATPVPALRVLVADDEDQLRAITRRILLQAGFAVASAADGEEALDLIRARDGAVDVVLSDILMPNMDGIELAVRAQSEFPGIHFVFMTGVSDISKDQERAADIWDAIISKPFDVSALVDTLRQATRID